MDAAARPERDYFPWVVGALIAATTVIAAAVALLDPAPPRPAMQAAPAVIDYTRQMPLEPLLAAAALPAPAPPTQPATAPIDAGSVPAAPPPPEPATRIWECDHNGLRTFSDAPCGAGAVARDIFAPNRMEAVPIRYGYPPSYYPPATSSDTSSEAPAWTPDTAVVALPYVAYRPERYPRHHGPAAGMHSGGMLHR